MRLAVTLLGIVAIVALTGHVSAGQDVTDVVTESLSGTSVDHHQGILPQLPAVPAPKGVPPGGDGSGDGQRAPVVGDPFGGIVRIPEMANAEMVAFVGLGALGLLGGILVHGGTRFINREEVLANPVRQNIYDYLKAKVGANLKQITDDLNLTTTNAIWHLRKLEDADLVRSRRFNGYKVFYPTEGGVEARDLTLSMTALQNGNAQEVFEFVVAHPGTHQREIARALAVNHGTVRWHLKKLRSADLLLEARRGKVSTYFPTPQGLEALQGVAMRQQGAPAPVYHGIDA